MRLSPILRLLALVISLGFIIAPASTPLVLAQPVTVNAEGLPSPFHPVTVQTEGLAAPLHPVNLFPSSLLTATGAALITAIDAQSFPDLTAYLSVVDAAGNHPSRLPLSAFSLAEDAAPLPAPGLSVSEREVGLQIVFVLDTSAAFKARDIAGVNRLDYIKTALTAFGTQAAPAIKDGLDDVTLLAPEGQLVTHSSQGRDFVAALGSYTSTFAGAADPLPLVNQALDFAAETMPRPGMPRYIVLFSNGLVVNGQAVPLADIVARAQSAQVTIDTVYVGPSGTSDWAGAQSLRQLANLTHGDFLVWENLESLTPLLQHLADQRLQYQLSYRSAISVTGQHTLALDVALPDGSKLASNTASFPIRVEPPVVSLAALPASLQLDQVPAAGVTRPYTVPMTVDFPDGHPRRLQALALSVDDRIVDTRQAAPLIWELGAYNASGPHTLMVRVTDELGLTAQSAPVAVMLSISTASVKAVPAPVATAAAVLPPGSNRWLMIGGLILSLGVIGGGGFWLARRARGARQDALNLRPSTLAPTQPTRAKAARLAQGDVTLPPVSPPSEVSSPPPTPRAAPFTLFPRKRPPAVSKPVSTAYLEVLEGGEGQRNSIDLQSPVLRLGRDATRAEAVFQDRSVSRLHARIVEAPGGSFYIYDEGSTSGTWVNFTQIPADAGWELKSGDVINLGRVQLRFKRREAPKAPDRTAPQPPAVRPPEKRPGGDGRTEPYRPVKK